MKKFTTKSLCFTLLFCFNNFFSSALSTWALRGDAILGSAQMINSTLSGYGDRTGQAISLSKDGKTLAVGSPQHTFAGTGDLAGKVGIYNWNGSSWTSKGTPLYAEAVGDYFGSAISLNANGTAIAVGAFGSSANGLDAGQVRVFTFTGSAWTQIGTDIEGVSANEKVGASVDISADGKTMVVGVSGINNVALNSGEVRVYIWNGTNWVLKGSAISGEAMDDYFGTKVSISADGNKIAASAPNSDTPDSEAGSVRVFSWNGSSWIQQGSTLNGRDATNYWGTSLKLNSTGNQLAIGTPYYDNSGIITGLIAIYTWTGSTWAQKGADIMGEGNQYLGNDLAVSSTGDTLVIGANSASVGYNSDGAVKTYRWSLGTWAQFTDVISGNRDEDNFGISVGISTDGKILAVGASGPDNLLNDGGHAQTYFLTCPGVNILQHPVSQTICGGSLATLNISTSGTVTGYLWSTGETTQSIQTSIAGTYLITVSGGCGNVVSNAATITTLPTTQITRQPISTSICDNSTTLSVAGTGLDLNYLWSTGETTATITTSILGVYNATVSGTCGIAVSSSASITRIAPPYITTIVSTFPALLFGAKTDIRVDALGSNNSYLWSTGATTTLLSNVGVGEYFVTVTGCGSTEGRISIANVVVDYSFTGYTFQNTFGSYGTGATNFMNCFGLNVDNNGRIYIADEYNHRISVWTQSGKNFMNIGTFGSYGRNPGEFIQPLDVSIGPDGRIYVAEHATHRVSVWVRNGESYSLLTTFGSYGTASNQLNYPTSVSAAQDGKIYVTDRTNGRISVWTQNGNSYTPFTTFGSFGSANDQFSSPYENRVTDDNKVFIADRANNRISVWSLNGSTYSPFATFGTKGSNSDQLDSPDGVFVAKDGLVYVADVRNNRISVWTQSGSNFTNFTTFGNDQLNGPSSVYVSSNNQILVAEINAHRISVWKAPAPIFYFKAIFDITAPTTFTGNTATLTWPTIPGAAIYCIRISKDKSLGTNVKTVCGLTGNTYSYNPNDPNARSEVNLDEYYFQVIGLDSAGNTSQWSETQTFLLNSTTTAIKEALSESIKIYPSPNQGSFTVESNGKETLEIYNYLGNLSWSTRIVKPLQTFNTNLSSGIYFVKINNVVKKIVIE